VICANKRFFIHNVFKTIHFVTKKNRQKALKKASDRSVEKSHRLWAS
jgi:hypothetical protein